MLKKFILILSFSVFSFQAIAEGNVNETYPEKSSIKPVSTNLQKEGKQVLHAPAKKIKSAKSAKEELIGKLLSVKSFSTNYSMIWGVGTNQRKQIGQMIFKRPYSIVLTVQQPSRQKMVILDGLMSTIDYDLENVIIKKARETRPLQLLSDNVSQFLQSYQVELFDLVGVKTYRIQGITDKNSGNVYSMSFKWNPITQKEEIIRYNEFSSNNGGAVETTFDQLEINGYIDKSVFEINFPKSYEVFDETSSNAPTKKD